MIGDRFVCMCMACMVLFICTVFLSSLLSFFPDPIFRLQTDIMFGKNHGLKTLAVLTGIVSEEDVLNAPVETRPDYYAASISGLLTCNEN